MFRKITRVKNEISVEEARQLLHTNRRGTLALHGDDGYPYAIPVNFIYKESDNRIYIHGAVKGHKIDAIRNNNKVCFTSWNDGYRDDNDWAYHVSSCVVFGRASLVSDQDFAIGISRELAYKYYPDTEESRTEIEEDIKIHGPHMQVIAIEIEHISGKKVYEK